MAIAVTFTFDAETVEKLDALVLLRRATKSAILRDLVAKEFTLANPRPESVSAETVVSDERA
jgi:predicted transcriptional regulator